MKWKNLKIGQKLGSGFGIVLILLILTGILSFTGVGSIVENAGEVISGNQLDGSLAQNEVDHLNWAGRVNTLLTDENVTELDVETDPRKCGFGQWYYGDERKKAEKLVPELKELMTQIEEPHKHLHESAIEIGKVFNQADIELGNFLREKKTDHMDWAYTVQNVFVDKSITKIKAETDHTKCGLGKWMFSAKTAELKKQFPELAAILEEMKEPHRLLHESAVTIQKMLDKNQRDKAAVFYMENTKPLAYETLALIDKALVWQDNKVAQMNEANHIYATRTMPNLKNVQELLGKIRETARENIMTDKIMLNQADATKRSVAIVAVIAIVFGLVIGFVITRALTGPILKAVGLANAIAIGDLSKTIDVDQKDEVGILAGSMKKMTENLKNTASMSEKIAGGDLTVNVTTLSDKDTLGHALKDMVEKLSSVMEEINTSSGNVAAGSEQMSSTSQSMSQGATEQASSLEEITSSMNEIGSQTKQNAENSSQANQLANDTKNAAEKGNSQMQEMVSAMTEINTSSQEISKIIKTIDEIAFQTNLLALNAAVEAARAGKQGKGFAVVAEEVRNLAARSAKAAKETADMIEGSVKKVEGGTEIANKTAEALGEIVGSVTKVTDLVGEIAAASNEQAQGISQITQGLGQIDQVTQQNTAHAEESASAAEELSSQAMLLQELVNTFKLSSTNRGQRQTDIRDSTQAQKKKMLAGTTAAGKNNTKDNTGGTWGSTPATVETDAQPEPTIHLDDNEFGKY